MKDHLKKCIQHLHLQATQHTSSSIAHTTNAFTLKQKEFIVPTILSAKKKELDLQFVKACITAGLPFTVYKHVDMKAAFHSLHPVYKLPNHKAIASRLLNQFVKGG